MFHPDAPRSTTRTFFGMAELVYHSIVREIRKSHRNALVGLMLNMLQTVMLVMTFYLMFSILGMRGSAIREDFMIYIMSGIFLYMCHTKTVGAMTGAEGPASAMMQHAPMNTAISVLAAALSALYLQLLSLVVVFVPISHYHHACLYRQHDRRIVYADRGMVQRLRRRNDIFCHSPLGTRIRKNWIQHLQPDQHDRLW